MDDVTQQVVCDSHESKLCRLNRSLESLSTAGFFLLKPIVWSMALGNGSAASWNATWAFSQPPKCKDAAL